LLSELHVESFGVIDSLTLVLDSGMTAITGETGAGKTLVVEAIELLVGGRADPVIVRPGAHEARIEGRFVDGKEEVVLSRVVPRSGRSRAYLNGHLATVSELADAGRQLVDLHGQHAHQSLLAAREQRHALDAFAGVDLGPLTAVRDRLSAVESDLNRLGGDARARAREIDLLTFQLDELAAAALSDPGEDDRLEDEENLLADASAHREAGEVAYDALAGDDGALDAVGRARAALAGRAPFRAAEEALNALSAELTEVGSDLRRTAAAIPEDPERLELVRARRRLLRDLRRKYGESLAEVIAFEAAARERRAELEAHGDRVAALESERAAVAEQVASEAALVAAARRNAAPLLSRAVEANLRTLAMLAARFAVTVAGDDPGDDVSFHLGANPGEPALPLAKVASGGELARTMLAARLVLTGAPSTLVFDEVDAGIGGEAALAVGRALSALASPDSGSNHGISERQVLVVTHLPQVAAFADQQVSIVKSESAGRTIVGAEALTGHDRVVELSRMLSGQPASATARDHAEELLATASRQRRGG
jgi:DNA repair protein RecN (Recombination protein N)